MVSKANRSRKSSPKMAKKYQIEATIEKLEQDDGQLNVQLKGTGKYLFEKSNDKKKDESKKYWNILEDNPDDKKPSIKYEFEEHNKLPIKHEIVEYDTPIYFNAEFKDLLIQAFIEKKSFKFDLEYEDRDKKYTITAISQPHAS